jgi:ornithine cyclodeaminase
MPELPASLPTFSARQVADALPFGALVESLRHAFGGESHALPRAVHEVPGGLVALMPVWAGRTGAVKVATVFPDNPGRGLPSIHAQVLLFDGATGAPVALVDGTEVTLRRTAAASALAASYLARPDASTLLVIGTGALAPHMAIAHAAVRPIRRIAVWGRTPGKSAATAARIVAQLPGVVVTAASDLATAAGEAAIISCATRAAEPVLRGAWLSPGAHVDLVGSFSAEARECDDAVVRGARIFVDTLEGALAEAGDVLIPLANGTIGRDEIAGELADLCRGAVAGRTSPLQTTVFKSVGAAIEDLIAAEMVLKASRQGNVA